MNVVRQVASIAVALACSVAVLAAQAPAGAASEALLLEKPLHNFAAVALSPDGTRVAAIESDDPALEGDKAHQALTIRRTSGGPPILITLPCGEDVDCTPSSPAWAPDSATLSFVLKAPKTAERTIVSVDATGKNVRTQLRFTGTLVDLRYSPQGRLAVLATAGAHKEVGATQAAAPMVGEIGAEPDEQRIATLDGGTLRFVSPADTYVYEYDWLPNGAGFVGTAAKGDGDDNWWIAELYAYENGAARLVYAPASPRQQLAAPRVSPDGASVAFIGGIMSDFGSTGGDVYVVPLGGGTAKNQTPNAPLTATAIAWSKRDPKLLYYAWLHGADAGIGQVRDEADVSSLPATERSGPTVTTVTTESTELDYRADRKSFSTGASPFAVANDDRSAVILQDFEHPPELAVGTKPDTWRPLTHTNAGIRAATHARAISWKNEGFTISGWLLEPPKTGIARRPMITNIHGGPSAAYSPRFVGRGTVRALLRDGYDVFEPNPRGSFGAGEAFTLANVRDFGYGDLRDILTGIDAVEKIAPVDDRRLGVTGYSYGGYMTMWTVTQTKRFAAAVAGAGVSDWLSYYGENGIDRWMIPFFGSSVYDDPAVYARSAPITFVKRVTTPTFEYVGERDVECPAPQTEEFWHALTTLHVPTQFVVYANEGHGLREPKDRADAERRTLAWFDKYLQR
jgi:dipeptidyl aminopeptidase/acylaminoacyl peptidase